MENTESLCLDSTLLCNSRKRKVERSLGPLSTEKTEKQKYFWTARAQSGGKRTEKFILLHI